MKILGIDPGTIQMGIGLLESEGSRLHARLIETIKTHPRSPLPSRLKTLYHALSEIFQIYRPDEVSLENVFFGKDFKSAIKIGEARSIAMLVAAQFSCPVTEYTPAKVKQSVCGNGQARKPQIQFMIKNILHLKTTPPVDSADALALAFCHYQNSKFLKKLNVSLETGTVLRGRAVSTGK
ncbi:MAG: crossover junction endodeoxyribonuclease RuvC [Candidatus Omnitrophica bacterium]|nr:crossover junction endodeoxyribonuclease RuvC [Candidatus Omnitrophota bacterium]